MAFEQIDEEKLKERVIHINRVAKVVKGGRRFSFSALVVVGDESGHVGVGLGKANEVPEAIRKGNDQARKNMFKVPLDGVDDPARVDRALRRGPACCSARPRRERASSPAARCAPSSSPRASTTSLTKCLGSSNPHNVVHATVARAQALRSARERRRRSRSKRSTKCRATIRSRRLRRRPARRRRSSPARCDAGGAST